MSTENIKLATLNVRGIGLRKKQCQLKRLLLDVGIDILAVQETKLSHDEKIAKALEPFLFNYEVCVSHAVASSGGCFLLLKKALPITELSIVTDDYGRFISCDFVLFDKEWRVICVYAPNVVPEREDFFRNCLAPFVATDKRVVVMGDFNCVCDVRDRSGDNVCIDKSARVLKTLVNDCDLVDVANTKACAGNLMYTRFQGVSHARLDRIYISLAVSNNISEYCVRPVSFSDHCLVVVNVGKTEKKKTEFNWNLWKLNEKLLNDEQFQCTMEKSFKSLSDENVNIFERWENFKETVKMSAIERSSSMLYESRSRERTLQANLNYLCRAECETPGAGFKDIEYIKAKLNEISEERYHGAVIRSRAEKFLLGEKPTKRALAGEIKYATAKEITSLQCGPLISNDKEVIANAFVKHYKTLFGIDDSHFNLNIFHSLLSRMPKLTEIEVRFLEQPIELKEIENVIDSLPASKSPGPDGLTAGFYRCFKSSVSPYLLKLFLHAYEVNVLPPSFTKTHTVLIPKSTDPEKQQQISSYRPITLCNVDYKIFTKVLSNRIQSVISNVIGDHQTCGIRGRTIQTNTHIARSVLDCCDGNEERVAMIQIDLQSAFDRVRHDVLFSVLTYVGFGHVILDGVKMAYRNCYTRLIINTALTDYIPIRSSVRQGCPLSPLLFALYLEPFCLSVAQSSSVHGFKLHACEVKVLAYADDVAVFCTDMQSVSEVVSMAKSYCDATGALVNWQKTSGFFYGAWDVTPVEYEGIRWNTEPCDYLGVPLQHHRNSNTYWASFANTLQESTSKWAKNELSIFARATVCNTFLVAKLCYVMQVLHCARANIQRFHRVFALFVWMAGAEPMRRDNIFRSLKSGGLGITHLFISQVVSRFFFLREQKHPFLRTIIQTKLANILPEFIVTSHVSEKFRSFGYFKEVVESFRFLSVRFSLDYLSTVTRRKLRGDLRDMLFAVPLYRSTFSRGPGQDVLLRVKKMPIPPFVKSFFFKLHSSTLPVKARLKERGIYVPWSIDCLLCKCPETVDHVFIHCWDAVLFWDVMKRTLKKDLYITPYTIRFLPVPKSESVPLDMLLILGLYSIWKSRMTVRHADPTPTHVHVFFLQHLTQVQSVSGTLDVVPEWADVVNELLLAKWNL